MQELKPNIEYEIGTTLKYRGLIVRVEAGRPDFGCEGCTLADHKHDVSCLRIKCGEDERLDKTDIIFTLAPLTRESKNSEPGWEPTPMTLNSEGHRTLRDDFAIEYLRTRLEKFHIEDISGRDIAKEMLLDAYKFADLALKIREWSTEN